jgi:hypothetical protein
MEVWLSGIRDYLLKLEDNLMVGSGRWIADFNESFWDYQINNLTFNFFIWGGMRPKGFALSKIAAVLVMPNYKAACFAYAGDPELKQLSAIVTAIQHVSKDRNIDWSWLVIPHESVFSPRAIARVEKDDTHELGIALVDLKSKAIFSSHSYVGRRMERFIRCFK